MYSTYDHMYVCQCMYVYYMYIYIYIYVLNFVSFAAGATFFNKCAATTPEDLERFWDGKTTETNNLWRPCVFARRELRSKCRGP